MSKKEYYIKKEDIKQLVDMPGYCFATDSITVLGEGIHFFYREKPDQKDDSGWRFFSGFESEEDTENPEKLGLYDLNTICNYSEDIIEFLNAPVNSAFERNHETGEIEEVFDFDFSQE